MIHKKEKKRILLKNVVSVIYYLVTSFPNLSLSFFSWWRYREERENKRGGREKRGGKREGEEDVGGGTGEGE